MHKILDEIYPLLDKKSLIECAKLFKYDIISALNNQPSSMPCILNPVCKIVPQSGLGAAVSIGGTNGYVSAFRIGKNKTVKFLNRKIFSLPQNTTKKDLFDLITRKISEVISFDKINMPIGIGLAYPLKPLLIDGLLDGEVVRMTKGRSIEGLTGKIFGKEYSRYLKEKLNINIQVTTVNDVVSLLLGAKEADIAGVVGTGLNFAYFEKRFSIAPLKLSEIYNYCQSEVAINLESANFDKIPGSTFRNILDDKDNKELFLAEKEAAGAYLYQIFNLGIKKLIPQDFPSLKSTDQINDIITGAFPYPLEIGAIGRKQVYLFAERLFHRSAQIVAIELCGILMKMNKTRGVIPIVMEGGLFWKAKNYPALVNLYVNMVLPEAVLSFTRLFGSSRRGIALLAANLPQ